MYPFSSAKGPVLVVFNRTAANNIDVSVPIARSAIDPVINEIGYLGSVVDSSPSIATPLMENAKRVFDIVFSAVALLILSPVVLAASLLIRLESPGAVFYKQERIGLNRRNSDRRREGEDGYDGCDRRNSSDRRKRINAGKPFNIYKLRTMRIDAEKSGPALSSKHDSRITRIGHILRHTRIDEIPQFINVIKGDMSIVGPRPERSFYINQIRQEVPQFPLRLKVRPGITGLAQVEDGYTDTVEKMKNKLYYDLKYISQLSTMQEIKILVKTVFVVFTGKGAC